MVESKVAAKKAKRERERPEKVKGPPDLGDIGMSRAVLRRKEYGELGKQEKNWRSVRRMVGI